VHRDYLDRGRLAASATTGAAESATAIEWQHASIIASAIAAITGPAANLLIDQRIDGNYYAEFAPKEMTGQPRVVSQIRRANNGCLVIIL
jgi:hypothetical protein